MFAIGKPNPVFSGFSKRFSSRLIRAEITDFRSGLITIALHADWYYVRKSLFVFFLCFFSFAVPAIFAQGYDLDWEARDYGDPEEEQYDYDYSGYREEEEEIDGEPVADPTEWNSTDLGDYIEEPEEPAVEELAEEEVEPPFVFTPTISGGIAVDFAGYKQDVSVPFALGSALSAEYRPFHFFSAGLKGSYHTDTKKALLHAGNILTFLRFYFLNLPKNGGPAMFFFEASMGLAIISGSALYSKTDYSGSFAAGIRIYPVSIFYIEHYGAYSYPGVWAAGITFGLSFPLAKKPATDYEDYYDYENDYGYDTATEYEDDYGYEYEDDYGTTTDYEDEYGYDYDF